MNRSLKALLVVVLAVSGTSRAWASELGYTLKVKGMVCAFCAYNVSRSLRSVNGVVPDSIAVDLDSGTITLRSAKALDRAELAKLIEDVGFTLEAVAKASTPPESSRPAVYADSAAPLRLTLDATRLEDGEFDPLLTALGVLASSRSARVAVVAPAPLELRVLRPILMGRKPAMDVHFSGASRPDHTVLISVSWAPEWTR